VTDQPSTPPMGERRRRREAERRRAQETGEGLSPPMTRRERRALEEALASGALELTPDGKYAPTGELPVTTTGQHALSGMETAASAEIAPSAETTGTTQRGSGPEEPAAGQPSPPRPEPVAEPSSPQPPERQSWRDTAQEVEALRPPPTMAPTSDGGASGAQVPSPGSGGTAGQDAVPGRVSRRSLRERRAESGASPAERPSERTATGRRPVIRPPASALGTRSVDGATGELTSIQRAIRDINAAPDEPASDSELHPVHTGSPEETSGAGEDAEEAAASSPSPTEAPPVAESPTATSAEEDEVDDSFDMSPRWPSVAAVTSRSPEPARPGTPQQAGETSGSAATDAGSPPTGASPTTAEPDEAGQEPALEAPDDDEDAEVEDAEEEDERHTPRLLQVLYWVVLVLAGVVLGLLVWRMANGDLFGDGDALATASRLLVLRQ